MNYKDLGLKINTEVNTVEVGENQIQVLQYLPIQDKIDLIQIALQKSEQNSIYNEMKLEMYFNLYLIYMYTNLEFSDEDKEDEFKLYNELESNGIILDVIGAMDEDEYDNLLSYLKVMQSNNSSYRHSAAALVQTMIQDMPKNAAATREIVDNFDKEKFNNVVEFAKSANGGRPI